MKTTSKIAYKSIVKELSKRQMEVYNKIQTFPGITIRETALRLKTFPHAISGRFTELETKGIIKTCKECKYFKTDERKNPHSMYELVKSK
jgi:DNA-binding transcriptional regulator YhcF (GntR family)